MDVQTAVRLEDSWARRVPAPTARAVVGIMVPDTYDPAGNHTSELEIADAVMDSGALPRLMFASRGDIQAQVAQVDALVAPGGNDVSPKFYGRPVGPGMARSELQPGFDRFEIDCIQHAYASEMPLLGICRGEQIMNVAGGGTLVQDLPTEWGSAVDHRPPGAAEPGNFSRPTHPIRVKGDSFLGGVVGLQAEVNSIHHQAIGAISPLLMPVAWAMDGVIEAVQNKQHPWQHGVQFHPEGMRHSDPRFQEIFQTLVDDAEKHRAGTLAA